MHTVRTSSSTREDRQRQLLRSITPKENKVSETHVAESTSASGAWGMRYPGLTMQTTGRNTVKEFTGMWPLKPDADLAALQAALVPGGWTPPDTNFAEATTKLGLIRTARWFVAKTQDFDGYTLFFVTQFDGTLSKYFDDFVLNGKENLAKAWGQCVGCPEGPDTTAADIVEFIVRGQIKTLACYDFAPSLSNSQVFKAQDWYGKAQKFQRAVAQDDGNIEDKVDAFLKELAEPSPSVPSVAVGNPDAAYDWQYEDVAEYLSRSAR
jgi:hypothetical protein